MNKLHLFARHTQLNKQFLRPTVALKELCALKSDDSDAKSKKENAVNKLNDLLKKMVDQEPAPATSSLKLAQPTNKRVNKTKDRAVKKEPVEKEIIKAVQDVAQTVPGDVKITESELLSKLLNPSTESTDKSVNLSDIVKGMKIDRETKPNDRQTRAEQVKKLLQRFKSQDQDFKQAKQRPRRVPFQKRAPELATEKIDLFGAEPLGIFTNKAALKDGVENKTWNELNQRELRLAITNPPANYFQQMILWTEQGKIWKFPIDNEQGLEEEAKVDFSEHVFLEEHLEPWCPSKGPIRHFMDLVCVGLSKNPYLTVEAKREHIEWYKNYFEDKKKLLLEVGAIPAQSKEAQKNLE